jgi:hypothetical protein
MNTLLSDNPTSPGWYATLHCWDVEEGMFPSAHYWTGSRWQPETSAGIQHWPIMFDTEDDARQYADDNDPDI